MHGWKFKRQMPFGSYVLDFCCFDADLVVEVDGSQHAEERAEHDRIRTQFLESEGLTVLRFWNNDVLANIDAVEETIYLALGQQAAPPSGLKRRLRRTDPSSALRAPSPQGEKEARRR